MSEPVTFGRTLAAIRKDRKLSLRQAAELGEIHHTTLMKIENDQREPVLSSLEAIATAYGLTVTITPAGTFVRKEDN